MAVPRKRHCKARTRKRRAHQSLTPVELVYCSTCQTPTLPHCVCPNCGSYRGRTVVEMEG